MIYQLNRRLLVYENIKWLLVGSGLIFLAQLEYIQHLVSKNDLVFVIYLLLGMPFVVYLFSYLFDIFFMLSCVNDVDASKKEINQTTYDDFYFVSYYVYTRFGPIKRECLLMVTSDKKMIFKSIYPNSDTKKLIEYCFKKNRMILVEKNKKILINGKKVFNLNKLKREMANWTGALMGFSLAFLFLLDFIIATAE